MLFRLLLMIIFSLANQSVRAQSIALFNPRPLPPVVTEDAPVPLPGTPVVSLLRGDYLFVACTGPNTISCVQTRFNGVDRPPILLQTQPLGLVPVSVVVQEVGDGVLYVFPGDGSPPERFSADPSLTPSLPDAAPGFSPYVPPTSVTYGDNELTLEVSGGEATVRTVNTRTGRTNRVRLEGGSPESLFLGRDRAFVVDKVAGHVTSLDPLTGEKTDLVQLRQGQPVQALYQEHRVLALSAAGKALVPLFINDARLAAATSPLPPTGYTEQLRHQPQRLQIGKVRLSAPGNPAALDTAITQVRTSLTGGEHRRRALPGLRRSIYDFHPIVEYTPRGLVLDEETELHFDLATSTGVHVGLDPVKARR